MKATSHHCPVCGRDESFRYMYEVKRFVIGKCARCGLGATELPPDFDPKSIYTEDYFEGGHDDGYADYAKSEIILRHEFRDAVAALRPFATPSGKLLEVGCAYGFFLKEAKDHFDVCGIEVSEHASNIARSSGLDVTTGMLSPEFLTQKGPFDAAVMLDVIEHLGEPDRVIEMLRDGLKPGGALLLTTGDWSAALSRVMGAKWRLMTPPQHLFFFDPKTLEGLLGRLGFRVQSVTHPWKRVPLSLILYQLSRYAPLSLLRKRLPELRGGLPLNLFDAVRVVATRV
jgi:SAM-dependent methyltransferase